MTKHGFHHDKIPDVDRIMLENYNGDEFTLMIDALALTIIQIWLIIQLYL